MDLGRVRLLAVEMLVQFCRFAPLDWDAFDQHAPCCVAPAMARFRAALAGATDFASARDATDRLVDAVDEAVSLLGGTVVEALLDSVRNAVVLYDCATHAVVRCSPATSTLLGFAPVGRRLRSLVHPDDVGRCFDKGMDRATLRLRHANGDWVWIEGSSIFLPEEQLLVLTLRSVSTERALEAKTAELQAVLDHCPVPLLIAHVACGLSVDYVSPSTCAYVGQDEAGVRAWNTFDHDDRDAVLAYVGAGDFATPLPRRVLKGDGSLGVVVSSMAFLPDGRLLVVSVPQEAEVARASMLTLLDQIQVGVVRTSGPEDNYRVLDVSDAWCRLTGYARSEVRGRTGGTRFLQGPHTDPTTVQQIREALVQGASIDVVLRNYTKDGRAFWCRMTAVRLPNGEYGGTVSDVSSTHDVEDAFRARHERLVAWGQIAIVECDPQMRVVAVNAAARRLWGLSETWVLSPGTTSRRFLGSFARDGVRTIRRADNGEPRTVRVTLVPQADGVDVVCVDLTDARRTEEQLANTGKELRQLIETANAPIFGVDTEGNVNEWNATTVRLTGYAKDEALGRPFVGTFLCREVVANDSGASIPLSAVEVQGVLDRALRGDETSNYSLAFRTKAGAIRQLLVNATTRRAVDGTVTGVVGVAQDVTEYEAALRRETDEASRADAEQGLNDYLAHEVRNPLSVAVGALRFVGDALPPSTDPTIQSDLQTAASALTYVDELLSTLLELNKGQEGKRELRTAPCCLLADVLEPVFEMMACREPTGPTLRVATSDPVWVEADALQLKQVVTNLVKNALKFVPSGEVRLGAERASVDSVLLWVEDTGPGIPPSKVGRLFDQYEQLSAAPGQGTGLGLALCRQMVEQMGGTIHLDPQHPAGARFVARLPLEVVPAPPPHVAEVEGTLVRLRGPYTALVVDDDPLVRTMLRRTLLAVGLASVDEAASGDACLRECERGAYDLLVVDHHMGSGRTGAETMAALRARGEPALVVGCSGNDVRAEHLAAGAQLFWSKPPPPHPVLADALRGALPLPRTWRVLVLDDNATCVFLMKRRLTRVLGDRTSVVCVQSGEAALELVRGEAYDLLVLDELLEGDVVGTDVARAARAAGSDAVIVGCSGRSMASQHEDAGCDLSWDKTVGATQMATDLAAVLRRGQRRPPAADPWSACVAEYGEDLASTLVEDTQARFARAATQLPVLAAADDWTAVHRLVHDVKGTSGMLRLHSQHDAASALHSDLETRRGTPADWRASLATLCSGLRSLCPPLAPEVPLARVLLVEDNEAQALAIEHRLVAAGLRVTVRTGRFAAPRALETLETDAFDLVVSDLHLGDPGVDGHAVCRAAADQGLFALLITADTSVCLADVGERVRFVSKPVTAAQVALMVREYEVFRQSRTARASTLALTPVRDSVPGLRAERDALLGLVGAMNEQFGVLRRDPAPPMTATADPPSVVTQRLLHVARLQNEVLELRLERAQEEAVVSHRHVARLSAVVQGEAVEVEVAPRPRLFWADAVVSERSVVQLLRPPRTLEVLASEGAAVYGVKLDGEVWVTFRNGEDRGRFTETLTQRFPSLETDRVVVAPSDWLGCAACRGVVHVSLVAEHARVCHRL